MFLVNSVTHQEEIPAKCPMGYAGAPGGCRNVLHGYAFVDVLDLPYPIRVKVHRIKCETHEEFYKQHPNNAQCAAGYNMTQLHGCWQVLLTSKIDADSLDACRKTYMKRAVGLA